MADEPDDIAEFQLVTVDVEGDEEMVAGCSGPRARALAEIVGYWRQCAGMGERRVYEITRIPVDLSALTDMPRILLPGGMQ